MYRTVILKSEIDLQGFRVHARQLLLADRHPDDVAWAVAGGAERGLWTDPDEGGAGCNPVPPDAPVASAGGDAGAIRLPGGFMDLCENVIRHSDMGRFALLYRMAWRLRQQRALWLDTLDADRVMAVRLARAVRRDMHKMTAFVRFRPLDDGVVGAPLQVAWFEPGHHVVEAVAPFFERRFANLRWAILTPRRSLHWDGGAMHYLAGISKDHAPGPDAGEKLWLTYYENIFNPARLKLNMMRREMPRRYWPNLPEAQLIPALSARAAQRTSEMIAASCSRPARRIVREHREHLLPDDAQVANVKTLPLPPTSLSELAPALDNCRDCPLGALATQAVPGQGAPRARLMLVGEQPGDQEDLSGLPFVGPAGKLLARAFAVLGWPRERLYVTNAVKHFKYELRGTRRIHKTPSQREAMACLQWLEREIALVQPEAIIALGSTAARSLMGGAVPVMKARGTWLAGPSGLPVLITLHPSALLRMPEPEKAAAFDAWVADLRLATSYL